MAENMGKSQENKRLEPPVVTPGEPVPSPEERPSQDNKWFSRKLGYAVAIVVNFALLYVFNNLLNWDMPYVTDRFSDVLWALNLSVGATIIGNLLFLAYDPAWFRRLVQIPLNVVGFISTFTLYTIFPFDLGNSLFEQVLKLALLVAMVGIIIGTVVEFFRLFLGTDK